MGWIPYCESYFPRGILRGENSQWEIPHGESDSLTIRHEFPNLSGTRNQIFQGEFPMENSLVGNSCEYFWWIPRKFQMNSTVCPEKNYPEQIQKGQLSAIIKQPLPRWAAYCISHGLLPPQLFVFKIATNLSTSASSYLT